MRLWRIFVLNKAGALPDYRLRIGQDTECLQLSYAPNRTLRVLKGKSQKAKAKSQNFTFTFLLLAFDFVRDSGRGGPRRTRTFDPSLIRAVL
jgi:hypothetical protein